MSPTVELPAFIKDAAPPTKGTLVLLNSTSIYTKHSLKETSSNASKDSRNIS